MTHAAHPIVSQITETCEKRTLSGFSAALHCSGGKAQTAQTAQTAQSASTGQHKAIGKPPSKRDNPVHDLIF